MADNTWTPYVAIYAAVIATVTLVWNVARDWTDRQQAVAVSVHCVSDGEAWISVANRSLQRRVQVRGVFGETQDGQGLSLNWKPALPVWLEPGESVDFDIPKEVKFLLDVENIGVVDGRGRKYFASRRAVQAAKATFARYRERHTLQ